MNDRSRSSAPPFSVGQDTRSMGSSSAKLSQSCDCKPPGSGSGSDSSQTRINEKDTQRGYAPDLSYLLHSLFGLDHYPNYLYRWNDSEISHLQAELQRVASVVETQRTGLTQLKQLLEGYTPEKCLPTAMPIEAILDSQLQETLNRYSASGNSSEISSLLHCEGPGVFSFPFLTPSFCESMLQDMDNYVKYTPTNCPTVLGRPIYLNLAKLEWLLHLLFTTVQKPLAEVAFPLESGQRPLDWVHGFIVGYAPEPSAESATTRTGLDVHTDDSEVTITVNLGAQFTGGKVMFYGERGSTDPNLEPFTVTPQLGKGLIHVGRMLHAVTPITSGKRYMLVLWARSRNGIRSQQCPCCWINRRELRNSDYICGPEWN